MFKVTMSHTTVTTYPIGTRVEVHSFGRWYPGIVTKHGRSRVTVRYTTGTGTTRDKAFTLDLVRAAQGPLARALATLERQAASGALACAGGRVSITRTGHDAIRVWLLAPTRTNMGVEITPHEASVIADLRGYTAVHGPAVTCLALGTWAREAIIAELAREQAAEVAS